MRLLIDHADWDSMFPDDSTKTLRERLGMTSHEPEEHKTKWVLPGERVLMHGDLCMGSLVEPDSLGARNLLQFWKRVRKFKP